MAECRTIFLNAEKALQQYDFETAMNLFKEAIGKLGKYTRRDHIISY